MRTVILFGLIAIADAINPNWHMNDDTTITVMSITIPIVIIMDFFEFFKKMSKK